MRNRDCRFAIDDIVAAIEEIERLTVDMTFQDFRENVSIFKAVLYDLAVIGEAARHMPEDFITRYREVPWREMSDMRNVVIHEYFEVDLQIIWETIKHDLPPLLPVLRSLAKE